MCLLSNIKQHIGTAQLLARKEAACLLRTPVDGAGDAAGGHVLVGMRPRHVLWRQRRRQLGCALRCQRVAGHLRSCKNSDMRALEHCNTGSIYMHAVPQLWLATRVSPAHKDATIVPKRTPTIHV